MTNNTDTESELDNTQSDEEKEKESCEKNKLSAADFENVSIDGAEDTSDEPEDENKIEEENDDGDDESEKLNEVSNEEKNDEKNAGESDGNEITSESFNNVNIDGSNEETNREDNGNDSGNDKNDEFNGGTSEDEFTDAEAASNWGGEDGNAINRAIENDEQKDIERHDIDVRLDNETVDEDTSEPDSNEETSTSSDDGGDSSEIAVAVKNGIEDAESDLKQKSNNQPRSRQGATQTQDSGGEMQSRSERLFGSDETTLDTSEDVEEDRRKRSGADKRSKPVPEESKSRSDKRENRVTTESQVGINEPSETIDPRSTIPPEGIGEQQLNSPIALVGESVIGVFRYMLVIGGLFVGVIKWVGKGIGKAFELLGTILLVYYVSMVGLGLIWPEPAGVLTGIGTTVTRVGVIREVTVTVLPSAVILLFIAVVIDKVVNNGNRFKKRERFERL